LNKTFFYAVSCGLDSMVFLLAVHKLSHRHRWELTVAHQSLVTLPDLALAEPGTHEHASLIGFEMGATAAGTAAENGEFDGHA
jgi:hypothetical protein